MSHIEASSSDLDDFALAGPHLTSAACIAALTRLRDLMTAPPAAQPVTETTRLASFARRISGVLDLAAEAVAEGDDAVAALEHGRALALINALRLTMVADGEQVAAGEQAPAGGPSQKSGSAG